MRPIGSYIILDEIHEDVKKTTGGLLLAEKHRDDTRYRKGKLVAVGEQVKAVKAEDTVWFDRHAGHPIEYTNGEVRVVIREHDIIIVE